jgi:predicted RNase H-like nuclease (RuvC/YqgF family)
MKTKVIIVVLIVIVVGLVIGLVSIKNDAQKQHEEDADKILYHSNQWSEVSSKLEDQKQVNLTLEKDIESRKADISKLSNDLSQASENLAKTQADLKASIEEQAKRDARIAELESQKDALD